MENTIMRRIIALVAVFAVAAAFLAATMQVTFSQHLRDLQSKTQAERWDAAEALTKLALPKNTGGRNAGSITAAMLLREFVDDTPWVHIDMAGVDIYDKVKGTIVKGASGIPVRTLVHLAFILADEPL